MAAIRSKDTRAELLLRKSLWEAGLRGYRCHHPGLPGKPDIAFTRWKVAIFVDGAFWHGHPDHFTFGKLGEYWDQKVRRTMQRDRDQEAALRALGYTVLRFWDFDVLQDPDGPSSRVATELSSRRPGRGGPAGRESASGG